MLARKMYGRTCFGRVPKVTCFARNDTNAGLKDVCTDEPVSAEFTRSPALPGMTKSSYKMCTDEPASAEFMRSPALPGMTNMLS